METEAKYVDAKHKKMAYGYTTGSCAAAAAKAAAYSLLCHERKEQITIITPKGKILTIPILPQKETEISHLDLSWLKEKSIVTCAVKKDAGDDPDVTNGVTVYASLAVSTEEKTESTQDVSVEIEGGIGVGRVTQEGLNQPVGAAAINDIPRKMIASEVLKVCGETEFSGRIKVLISIPEGVELAKKTFNGRLGIIGGISVLGTSGIVEPMSKQALLDTIALELKMKKTDGRKAVVLSPGNMGMDFMKSQYHYHLDEAVKCSNFIGETLDFAVALGYQKIILVGNIGKLVKLAGGIMNTHSREADCRMEILCASALLAGAESSEATSILSCLTTEEVMTKYKECTWFHKMTEILLQKIEFYLQKRVGEDIEIGVIVYSSIAGEIAGSKIAKEFFEEP